MSGTTSRSTKATCSSSSTRGRTRSPSLARGPPSLRHAKDSLTRLEPRLPRNFLTEDRLHEARTRRMSAAMTAEQARTSVLAADAALEEARPRKQAARATLAATRAQHLATEAALQQ